MSWKLRMLTILAAATVLVAIAVPALAATPKVGKWHGSFTYTYHSPVAWLPSVTVPVQLKFATVRRSGGGQGVKGFSLTSQRIIVPCTNEDHFSTQHFETTLVPKVRSGKFHFTQTRYHKTLEVAGRFTTRTRASGVLEGRFANSHVTCSTGQLHWRAKLG